jgi:hypothetical protein
VRVKLVLLSTPVNEVLRMDAAIEEGRRFSLSACSYNAVTAQTKGYGPLTRRLDSNHYSEDVV